MRRYMPLTAVLLAFWLGSETGAGDKDVGAKWDHVTLKVKTLTVDRIFSREINASGKVNVQPFREEYRTTIMPGVFVMVKGESDEAYSLTLAPPFLTMTSTPDGPSLDVDLRPDRGFVRLAIKNGEGGAELSVTKNRTVVEVRGPDGRRLVSHKGELPVKGD